MQRFRLYVYVVVAVTSGCGDDGSTVRPDGSPSDGSPSDALPMPDGPVMAAQMIDEQGGMVQTPGGEVTLSIPPGSVDGDTMITVAVSTAPPPAGAQGPVYEFGPAGLVFAHPVTITLAMPAGVTTGDVYWSKPGGAAGFDNVGGAVSGSTISTQIAHFSEGYVGPAETTRTVTGSQMISWVSASTFVLQPADLTTFQVAALVDDGAGGYTVIDGTGRADGTFTIPNVPDGPYLLRVPPQFGGTAAYFRTSASVVDAGYTLQGRPGLTPLTTATPIVLNVTNLAPWQDGDQIEMFSTEAFGWHFFAEARASAGVPVAGDTALSDFTYDLSDSGAGTPSVIDGSRTPPDRFVVAQLTSRMTTENVAYTAMSRVFEPAPFTVVPGQTTTVTGAFTDIATAQTITADIRGAAITAARNEETRPCTPSNNFGWTFYVLGVAGGLQHGSAGNTADLLALEIPRFSGDVVASNMGFGNPPSGTWGLYVDARFTERCTVKVPGTNNNLGVGTMGFSMGESFAQFTAAGPLSVRLGQVRAPKIANQDLYTANTGIGTTPVISWTAPSIGTATFYTVTVTRVYADASNVGRRQVLATLTTDQTSIKMPSGILTAGEYYTFQIEARSSGKSDASALNREVLPEYFSFVTSAIQQM